AESRKLPVLVTQLIQTNYNAMSGPVTNGLKHTCRSRVTTTKRMLARLPKLEPMRLTRRPSPFNHAEWTFELKLDGFRALAYIENGEGRLVSRNGNTFASFRDLGAQVAASFRGVAACLMARLSVSTSAAVLNLKT